MIFESTDRSPRYKRLAVFIPGVSGGRLQGGGIALGEACFHAIKQREKWAGEIEKLEASNTEFSSAGTFFTLHPALIIFHITPMSVWRADKLRQQGHELIGPEQRDENP